MLYASMYVLYYVFEYSIRNSPEIFQKYANLIRTNYFILIPNLQELLKKIPL